ncbi:MAG: polysaccharide export protein [Acidobacteriia bacterium]|nr:polysaccharide export protein [Terriglobia bacterium]
MVLFLAAVSANPALGRVAAEVERSESGPAPAEQAELRVGLPEGSSAKVSVLLGEGGLVLDLPKGASYPLDFVAASGGLLRGAKVVSAPGDRIHLELMLAGGLCNAISYEPSAVVLTLRRRGSLAPQEDDATQAYRLGPEDKILVTITGRPELTQQLVVTGNGTVTAPLVGDVTASGLTVRELVERLTELLARDYLVDPQVEIQVLEYKSKWVMVTGNVRTPGRVALKGSSKLKDVVADAGGLSEDAGEEIVISRAPADGSSQPTTLTVQRESFERGEVDPPLSSGDIVNVKPALYVYLQGEVHTPGRVRVERGMTLLKAIALAGGLTEWANHKSVQILHEGSSTRPIVVNMKEVQNQVIEDPPMKGGEIVIVKRRFL